MEQDRAPSPAARVFVVAVAAAGVAVMATQVPKVSTWNGLDLLAWAGLTAAIALTEQFRVPVRYRTESLNLSLTEALWIGALIAARPSVLSLAMGAGVFVAQVVRRRGIYKIGFNVGQFVVALAVGQVIYGMFPHHPPRELGAWMAAAVAMAGYAVVNSTLVAGIIALMERQSLIQVIRRPLFVNVVHFAGNTAIGLAGAVISSASPLGLPLFGVPLGLAYIAYRTMAQSLQAGNQARDLIVENASDGIFLTSPDGEVMSWNPAMERISGYLPGEAIGWEWRDLLDVADVAGTAPPAGGGTLPFVPLRRRDGTVRWVHYSANVVANPDGRPRAAVVVVHDATAEHEAEQLKSDFVATISHELRTPLTPLKGFIQTLLGGTADDSEAARQEYYRIMLKQADRLESLINQLLEVCRIESDSPLMEDQPVDLRVVIADQVRAFSERQPDRPIDFRLPAEPVVVRADPTSVGLVLSNLVSNACKYSKPDTPVEVRVSQEAGEAVVSVRDAGEGVSTQDREQVFDRFFKGHSGMSQAGVGLGLYIAKRLVEAMGGRIWFESEPGAGSSFFFALPSVPAVSPVVASEPRPVTATIEPPGNGSATVPHEVSTAS